jgi:hypothetical protein
VKEVLDGARGSTNRQRLVSALYRRTSMRRLRVLSLYHRRQDVARMQEPGRMDDAGRVLPVPRAEM